MRAGLWLWPSRLSPWGPQVAGCSSRVLLLAIAMLFLLTSPISAQSSPSISPIGPNDYLEYKASLAVLEAKQAFYRDSLRQALAEKLSIERSLADERQKYDELLASAMQHSDDSTTSYEQQRQTIQRLTERLSASETSVSALQASLASAAADYDQKLAEASDQAKRLERKVLWWKVGAIAGWIAALVAGGFAIVNR